MCSMALTDNFLLCSDTLQAVDWALYEHTPVWVGEDRVDTVDGASCLFASYALAFYAITKQPRVEEISLLTGSLLQHFDGMEARILANAEPDRILPGFVPLFSDIIPRTVRVIAASLSQLALQRHVMLCSDTSTGRLATRLHALCTQAMACGNRSGYKHYEAALRVLSRHESNYKVSSRALDSHRTLSEHPSSRKP